MASYIQRGTRWRALVVRKGVRKSKSFDLKTQARAWATKVEAEIDASTSHDYVPAAGKVGELIALYIADMKQAGKSWGRSKDGSLAQLQAGLGEVRVRDLTVRRIIAYARDRAAPKPITKVMTPRARRAAASGAGPVTVAAEMSYLGGVLKFGRSIYRLNIPSTLVPEALEGLEMLGLVGKSKERDRVVKDEELARIKAAWGSRVPFEVVEFALETAMRLSEIAGLRRSDLDGKTILIRDRKHPTEKIGNHQRVPLLGRAPDILAALPCTSDRYFPFSADTIASAWKRACKVAGIDGLRFHDLRHSGVTRLFKKRYSIAEVSLVSGHRSWQTLKRYANLTAADVLEREAAD